MMILSDHHVFIYLLTQLVLNRRGYQTKIFSINLCTHSIKKHLIDHAWFTAFAPAYDPKIAIAVIVENGGSGSGVAGPMAKSIMNAWITDFKDMDEIIPLNDAGGE